MERVVKIVCAKCRTPLLWVEKKTVDNAWLFDKCKLLGIDLYVCTDEAACVNCGQAINLPLDVFQSLARTKGIDIDPDREIDLKRI